jgi:hypothetical protein
MKAASTLIDGPRSLIGGKLDTDMAFLERGMTFRLLKKIVDTPFFQKLDDENVCIAFVAKLATSIAMTILQIIESLLFFTIGVPILSLTILAEGLFCKKTSEIGPAFMLFGGAILNMILSFEVTAKGPFDPKNGTYFYNYN